MFCRSCGAALVEGDGFCGECGVRVEKRMLTPPLRAEPSNKTQEGQTVWYGFWADVRSIAHGFKLLAFLALLTIFAILVWGTMIK